MSATATAIVDLNLLPASQRPAEISGRAAVTAAAFLIAILALVPVAWQVQRAESRASGMEQRLERAQDELRGVQLEFVQARARRVEIDHALTKAASLETERNLLQQGRRPLHEDLTMLSGWGFLPPGARITRVAGEPNAFRVEGLAAGPLDAIAYAEKLKTDGGFPSARMASFTPGSGGGVFVIEMAR